MKTLMLEEMSYPEVANALADGYKTVIIAAGATEQHGPHLPIGTDNMLGIIFAKALAEELGNTLIAPIIPLGLSRAFIAYPGSLTIKHHTFMALLEDFVDGYVQHGFETIILLPSHFGNFAVMGKFAKEAAAKYPDTKIICCFNYDVLASINKQSFEMDGVSANIAGTHAGEAETSMMLAFYPDFVDMALAEEGFTGDLDGVRDKMLEEGVQTIAKNGILGDARLASAERGKKIAERLLKAFAENIH